MRWKVREANKEAGASGASAADDEIPGLAHNADNPEISFRAFVSVYNQTMGTFRVSANCHRTHSTCFLIDHGAGRAQRRHRQQIKTTFEDLMQSPRGLHRSEMARLIKRVEKRLLLLPPRFNLERDWKLMLELAGHQSGIGRLDTGGLTRVIDKTVQANKVKSEMPASATAEPDKHSAKQPPYVLYLSRCSEAHASAARVCSRHRVD